MLMARNLLNLRGAFLSEGCEILRLKMFYHFLNTMVSVDMTNQQYSAVSKLLRNHLLHLSLLCELDDAL